MFSCGSSPSGVPVARPGSRGQDKCIIEGIGKLQAQATSMQGLVLGHILLADRMEEVLGEIGELRVLCGCSAVGPLPEYVSAARSNCSVLRCTSVAARMPSLSPQY